MRLKISIGTKIFGLCIFLLGITVALAIFSTWASSGIVRDLKFQSRLDVPLQSAMGHLDEHALLRRLAFEQWRAALENPTTTGVDAQASEISYNKYDAQLRTDFVTAEKIIATSGEAQAHSQIVRIRGLFLSTQANKDLISSVQRRILALLPQKNRGAIAELSVVLERLNEGTQKSREDLSALIGDLSEQAALDADRNQRSLLTVMALVTTFAILTGLLFAFLMTKRMVQPVRSLMNGMKLIEGGDLSARVSVESRDEIGSLTNSFNLLADELRSKELMKETFGKYMDPKILENVILNPNTAETSGGRRQMTVGFGDLVGFTTISEMLTPTALVKVLNRHFELTAKAIHEHQGVVDKFIGDAVMAFWGPPFSSSTMHALLSCESALMQIAAMKELNTDVPEITGLRKTAPRLDLRIGLATGEILVGNLGSEKTKSYTVIGDTVNLASRLEGLNRIYGTAILVNDELRQQAGVAIETRELDWVAVKGKSERTTVYELLGLSGAVPAQILALRDVYEKALAAYRSRDWDTAEAAFTSGLKEVQNDSASLFLLSRIRAFRAAPPPENWAGVLQANEK